MLVGALSETKEQEYGALFSKYLADPSNLFIISSDFCHWGECRLHYVQLLKTLIMCLLFSTGGVLTFLLPTCLGQRFRYTYYDESQGEIYRSIENLDKMVGPDLNCA